MLIGIRLRGEFMKLEYSVFKDKIIGCWLGKNIGGVLGAPFEGKRQINNVDFYVQDLNGNPPANDDLDLQLVWLNAVEQYGRQINANILSEYWLSYIIPNWVEYGSGKNNLNMGFLPPISGYLENPYKNSCGCFIRSEIWACLAPGHPEIAVRYAYEDAIVDHSDEGLYAEIFCAAVQSAAFVESDKYELIDIGLSYIPESCGIAKGIKTAIDAFKTGNSIVEARKKVLTAVPGSFGIQGMPLDKIPQDVPVGKPGYDAPSNIGIIIIGWLYGEDDFGKSLCIANNCGEDTDCTCATLGAILGIVHGSKWIPRKWTEPIGDIISTICINKLNGGLSIPETVTELADRLLRLTPSFLGAKFCDILAGNDGYTIDVLKGENLNCSKGDKFVPGINTHSIENALSFEELIDLPPYAVKYQFPAFHVIVDYMGDPYVKLNNRKIVKLVIRDSTHLGSHNQQWINIKWYYREGIRVLPSSDFSFFMQTLYKTKEEIEFEILVENFVGYKIELLVDISVNGRHSNGIIKVVLIPKF